MRKLSGVWEDVCSWGNLALAHKVARRGKRRRPEVARFDLDWETELLRLRRELLDLTWFPGPFRTFTIYESKPRRISAVPYRDRVVHQAIMNILGPHLDRTLIYDTYACRVGKGTEAARLRAQHFLRGRRYFLHMDVVKYFPSISLERLKARLRRYVSDRALLEILDRILDHNGHPWPGDLFEWAERRGLPIGSLTSQHLANLYLSPLDHHLLEVCRPGGYVRYMDDLVVFDDSKRRLWEIRDSAREFAEKWLALAFHDPPRLAPREAGLSFLGMRVWGHSRRLLPPSGHRFVRRMRGALRAFRAGRIPVLRLRAQAMGWLGHARQANTIALQRSLWDRINGRRPGARIA